MPFLADAHLAPAFVPFITIFLGLHVVVVARVVATRGAPACNLQPTSCWPEPSVTLLCVHMATLTYPSNLLLK